MDEAQNPLWFWNDKLENDELVRQLQLKTNTGIKSTIPHARLNGGDGYIGGYLDEDWFEKFQTVVDYKKEHNEIMWLYDEMDWPAGTCNKTITKDENNREQYLWFQTIELKAGEIFRCQLEDVGGRPIANKHWEEIKNYALNVRIFDKQNNVFLSLEPYVKSSMFSVSLDFLAEEDCTLYMVQVRVDSYDSWGAGCVNYLDADVTDQFIASTYDVYYGKCKEEFGNTIRAVFNDETRMANAFPWSKDFAKEFEKRKGYDFLPHVFELILPGEEAGFYRCDYFEMVATLFQENFFGRIQKWCHEHDIKLFAHLLGEETLGAQVRYSGDFMRQMKCLDIAGADHLGKGIGSLNIKFTSSAARSYGVEKTAVEVFAGCGWDMTFEEYIRIISWMYQQGMQSIINHGFFYSTRDTRKNDWPPSQFFQWKHWDKMSHGNDLVRRLHYALTGGTPENDVLVYYPVETFWMDYIGNQYYKHGYEKGPKIEGKEAHELDIKMQKLLQYLQCENLDFELLHKDAMENFEVVSNQIQNKKNAQKFQTLVLPWTKVISIEAMRTIAEFARNTGSVFVLGELPKYAMERDCQQEFEKLRMELEQTDNVVFIPATDEEKALCSGLKEVLKQPVRILTGDYNNHNSYVLYEDGLIDPYVHTNENIYGIRFIRYQKDGRRNTFFVNYDDKPREVTVEVSAAEDIELWDTLTGEITKPNVLERDAKMQKVSFVLPCNYGVVMVSDL